MPPQKWGGYSLPIVSLTVWASERYAAEQHKGKAMVEIIVHTSNGSEIIPVDMSYVEDSNIDAAVMMVVNRHFAEDEVLSARWHFA